MLPKEQTGHGAKGDSNVNLKAISYNAVLFSPFEHGDSTHHAQMDVRMLLAQLHAEQEDVRSQQRLCRRQLEMVQSKLKECGEGKTSDTKKAVPWLAAAVGLLVLSLLCGLSGAQSCSGRGWSGFFLVAAGILVVRWLAERWHIIRNTMRVNERSGDYRRQIEELEIRRSELNLRERELEDSIRAAERMRSGR